METKHVNTFVDCKNRTLYYIPKLPTSTKIIDFSWNVLPEITNHTMTNLSNIHLTNVSFRHCGIENISSDAFASLPTLKILDLSENNLTWTMVKEGVKGLQHSNLTALNISSLGPNLGDITHFDTHMDLFGYLKNTQLQNISMRNDNIEIISGDLFKDLPKLSWIDLSQNKIYNFSLKGLDRVKYLNLTMNEFKYIPTVCDEEDESFVPSLETLHLAINSISDTYRLRKMGSCFPNLKHLNLSFNPIRTVKGNSFARISNLHTLSLKNLFVFDVKFEVTAFNSSTLEVLHIGNSFRAKPSVHSSRVFSYCPKLRELDLTKIKLSCFEEKDMRDMLSPLKNLTTLILDSTRLEVMPPLDMLPKLEVLVLRKNSIRSVQKGAFVYNTKLRKLSLSFNQITVFTPTSFPASLLSSIEEIDLGWNPYACTCELEWFLGWIRRNEHKLTTFYPKYYQCDSPKGMDGTLLKDVSLKFEDCNHYIVMATVLGAVSVAVFIVVVVIRKYRWDIKYYIYLARSKRGYQRIPEGEEFFYDAFVAYNENDRAWVMAQIVETLERKGSYKLCLHERDFVPGEIIVDQITDKVKASRRFILVISNSFAKSQWCQFEILLAQSRLVEDGADILIPVLLEDVKARYMSASLKFLLKSLTFLEWTTDPAGKELFFNKLQLAMKK